MCTPNDLSHHASFWLDFLENSDWNYCQICSKIKRIVTSGNIFVLLPGAVWFHFRTVGQSPTPPRLSRALNERRSCFYYAQLDALITSAVTFTRLSEDHGRRIISRKFIFLMLLNWFVFLRNSAQQLSFFRRASSSASSAQQKFFMICNAELSLRTSKFLLSWVSENKHIIRRLNRFSETKSVHRVANFPKFQLSWASWSIEYAQLEIRLLKTLI